MTQVAPRTNQIPSQTSTLEAEVTLYFMHFCISLIGLTVSILISLLASCQTLVAMSRKVASYSAMNLTNLSFCELNVQMHSAFFFKNPCPWVRFWYVSHSLLHFLSFSCIFLSFDMLSITFSAFSTVPVYQIHQAHCRQLWLPRITWSNSSVARLRSNRCITTSNI